MSSDVEEHAGLTEGAYLDGAELHEAQMRAQARKNCGSEDRVDPLTEVPKVDRRHRAKRRDPVQQDDEKAGQFLDHDHADGDLVRGGQALGLEADQQIGHEELDGWRRRIRDALIRREHDVVSVLEQEPGRSRRAELGDGDGRASTGRSEIPRAGSDRVSPEHGRSWRLPAQRRAWARVLIGCGLGEDGRSHKQRLLAPRAVSGGGLGSQRWATGDDGLLDGNKTGHADDVVFLVGGGNATTEG